MTAASARLRGARRVAVVGGGPAGLMAAEVLATGGVAVDLYDGMATVGRKFLLAGRGGLNLTHSEPAEAFVGRYGDGRAQVARWLDAFGPADLRAWAEALGIATFAGSSGRVFPVDLKAAPLLRRWLQRLREGGVALHARHRWLGFDGVEPAAVGRPRLRFATPGGTAVVEPDAVVLALGGASWQRLGSDGAWVPWLVARGVDVAPLVPSNCGFDVGRAPSFGSHPASTPAPALDTAHLPAAPFAAGWSEHFRSRFAGQPLKTVALRVDAGDGAAAFDRRGEFVVTETGIEGSLVYAASSRLREAIAAAGPATVRIDLLPDRALDQVRTEVARPRGPRSLSTHLKSRLGLHGVKAALLRELAPRSAFDDAEALARQIKSLALVLVAPRPIDEAISSAGGVRFDALDDALMLRTLPGVFCAGEMLDWDAPTGGYLLTACCSSGRVAAHGTIAWLEATRRNHE